MEYEIDDSGLKIWLHRRRGDMLVDANERASYPASQPASQLANWLA